MKIPDAAYRSKQRSSVFQKVDLEAASSVPLYEKTKAQLDEIMPLLRGNFLIKSLSDDEVKKIAGAMKPESHKKDDIIIRYGDSGK